MLENVIKMGKIRQTKTVFPQNYYHHKSWIEFVRNEHKIVAKECGKSIANILIFKCEQWTRTKGPTDWLTDLLTEWMAGWLVWFGLQNVDELKQ